jgi:hypothetical protein
MSGEYTKDRTFNMEKTLERKVIVVGRLGQLDLGNKKGIPSRYREASAEELQEMADAAARKLLLPTDTKATGCIDGRKKLRNMDGSTPEIRYRRVGGSASNLGVALNAEASFMDTLDPAAPLEEQIEAIDQHVAELTGFERSAHTGGCGGANGEIDDNEAINTNPAILKATEAFMAIPEVQAFFMAGHEDDFRDPDSSDKENPRGVEDLEVDHEDHAYHGHKEGAIFAVIGDETYPEDDDFVWNLKASKEVAEALSGQRGSEGYVQALIAEVAKHLATSSRLASTETPVAVISK